MRGVDYGVYAPEGRPTPTVEGTADREGLLSKDEKTQAATALKIWESKDQIQRRREAQWTVNEWRRAGAKNVMLRRRAESDWYPWVPPHIEQNPDLLQSMNQAAAQCRKFTSLLLADPPAPDCAPASGEDKAKDAAEVSARALIDEQSEGKINDQQLIRRAFDKANTFGSGFIWYYMDPKAGGKMPVQVAAGVNPSMGTGATSEEDLTVDPQTGLPWPEFVERYVAEDGSLTNDPAMAKSTWVSGVRGMVLTGRNVRMIPHTAQFVTEAEGVQIAMFTTLGELKRLYPERIKTLDEEEKQELFNYRPEYSDYMLPPSQREILDTPPEDENERPVFTLCTYFKAGDEFEDGLFLITAGNCVKLAEAEWVYENDGALQSLPLPLTQYKQWAEGDDDPYGHGLMELLGPGNEIRAKVIADWLEHLTRLNSRKVFIPMASNLRNEDVRLPSATPIRILPGGEPKYEDIPAFPADGIKVLDFTTNEMRTASGLTQIAEGMESPQVQSGRHAQAIISQVHSGLSEIRQNIITGYVIGCQVQLALFKAFYKRERRIGWVGEDGAYKEKRWSGADLGNTTDVFLKNGTLTMLSPVAKSQLAEHFYQLGTVSQQELKEITQSNMGAMIGLQDDAYFTRIRRQLARYLDGPPQGWQPGFGEEPVMGPPDPMTGQATPMVDTMTGAPQMQQVQIMDPVLLGIFRPYPCDDLPHVALKRLNELGKAMSGSTFATLPAPWQFGLIQEFVRAQAASMGVPGPQPGQPPSQMQSPAQRTEGPLAPPQTPLPSDNPAPAQQVLH